MSYGHGYGYGYVPHNPLDVNHDGLVTQQDLAFVGARYGPGGAAAGAALFNQLDTNHNGVLDAFDARPTPNTVPVVHHTAYPTYPTYPTYPVYRRY